MKKLLQGVAGLVLAIGMIAAVPAAQATNIGNKGCTPGYWKNHSSNWFEAPGLPISTNKPLKSHGPAGEPGFNVSPQFDDKSFMDALNFGGGSGLLGAERNLLRAAAAAWLNAAHEGVGYPYRRWGQPYNIVRTVNSAIASADRATMLSVAKVLDDANNLGCPLN